MKKRKFISRGPPQVESGVLDLQNHVPLRPNIEDWEELGEMSRSNNNNGFMKGIGNGNGSTDSYEYLSRQNLKDVDVLQYLTKSHFCESDEIMTDDSNMQKNDFANMNRLLSQTHNGVISTANRSNTTSPHNSKSTTVNNGTASNLTQNLINTIQSSSKKSQNSILQLLGKSSKGSTSANSSSNNLYGSESQTQTNYQDNDSNFLILRQESDASNMTSVDMTVSNNNTVNMNGNTTSSKSSQPTYNMIDGISVPTFTQPEIMLTQRRLRASQNLNLNSTPDNNIQSQSFHDQVQSDPSAAQNVAPLQRIDTSTIKHYIPTEPGCRRLKQNLFNSNSDTIPNFNQNFNFNQQNLEHNDNIVKPEQIGLSIMEQPDHIEGQHTLDDGENNNQEYTLAEVRQHCRENDLWVIIDDKVYDFTEYWRTHPGGGEKILELAGSDITAVFHSPVNHPSKIPAFVARNYEIGVLKKVSALEEAKGAGGAAGGASSGAGGEGGGGADGKGGGGPGGEKDRKLPYNLNDQECRLIKKQFELICELSGGLVRTGDNLYDSILSVFKKAQVAHLFTTPKKVMAFSLIRQVQRLVNYCSDEDVLNTEIYNTSMRHINYISLENAVKLKDSFIEQGFIRLWKQVLEEEWMQNHDVAWRKFLEYVVGNMILKLDQYGNKVLLIRSSWKEVDALKDQDSNTGGFGDALYFNLGVMSHEIFSLIHMSRDAMADSFNRSFDMLTRFISEPTILTEELFILAARHLRYGTQRHHFPVFGQAVIVTLRSLLPHAWNYSYEESWSWLWHQVSKSMVSSLENGHRYKKHLDLTAARLNILDFDKIGQDFCRKFFDSNTNIQGYFNKPQSMMRFIVTKTTKLVVSFYKAPHSSTREIRALGIRHIKYDAPSDYFPNFCEALCYAMGRGLGTIVWTDEMRDAWSHLLQFMSNCLSRALYGGTTLITRALIHNSISECREALDQAPRCERNLWMLEVDVSGTKVSPFYWGLSDAKYDVCDYMLSEILSIRADRNKYYCGKDDLFRVHPDLVAVLCHTSSKHLLFVLLDGLMWESNQVLDGMKRVNYFVRDLYGNPFMDRYIDVYSTPLASLVNLFDDEAFNHPSIVFLLSLQWRLFGRRLFLKYQTVYLVTCLSFMLGFVFIDRQQKDLSQINYNSNQTVYSDNNDDSIANDHTGPGGSFQGKSDVAFVFRIITVGLSFLVFVGTQLPLFLKEWRQHQTIEILHIPHLMNVKIPISLTKLFNFGRLLLMFTLLTALVCDQNLEDFSFFKEMSDEAKRRRREIQVDAIAISAILIWLLTFELWEFSLELLRLRQRCELAVTDFAIFLLTAMLVVFVFASSMWLAEPRDGFYGNYGRDREFDSLWSSMMSLFTSLVGLLDFRLDNYTGQMLFFFWVFSLVTFFVLLRFLFGIFVISSIANYAKLNGYALLRRATTLIALQSRMSIEEREKIWIGMGFDDPVDFDEGDLGLSGGVQVIEDVADFMKMQSQNTGGIHGHMNGNIFGNLGGGSSGHGKTQTSDNSNSQQTTSSSSQAFFKSKQKTYENMPSASLRQRGDRIMRYAGICGDWLPWPKIEVHKSGIEETIIRIENLLDNFSKEFKVLVTKLNSARAREMQMEVMEDVGSEEED